MHIEGTLCMCVCTNIYDLVCLGAFERPLGYQNDRAISYISMPARKSDLPM